MSGCRTQGFEMESDTLIQRYLIGIASEEEVQELERRLEASPDLRRSFVRASQLDSVGRDSAIEQSMLESRPLVTDQASVTIASRSTADRWRTIASLAGLAASLLLIVLLWSRDRSGIAVIVSSENAAWESSLPTLPGDQLHSGTLHLRAGVATIRFHRGAELLLEAPATLELISDMRCRLDSGAAIVDVPDSAIGFVVESPGGYAEDFGTRFAVRVNDVNEESDFELIEGEIEVHHDRSGDSVRLREAGSTVAVSDDSIRRVVDAESPEDEVVTLRKSMVIGTNGRCGTAMPRFDKRWKYIDPTVLSVKRSGAGRWDYRSFFEFDLTGVDLTQVATAQLRVNLVPSQRGLVSRLPKVNRFGIYGLTNDRKAGWEVVSTWDDSPGPEDGELLGSFDVERSQTRGVFGIDGKELLAFLRRYPGQPVTLILWRETTQIEGVGPGLTHMFASDSHPESVGPQLVFTFK